MALEISILSVPPKFSHSPFHFPSSSKSVGINTFPSAPDANAEASFVCSLALTYSPPLLNITYASLSPGGFGHSYT